MKSADCSLGVRASPAAAGQPCSWPQSREEGIAAHPATPFDVNQPAYLGLLASLLGTSRVLLNLYPASKSPHVDQLSLANCITIIIVIIIVYLFGLIQAVWESR